MSKSLSHFLQSIYPLPDHVLEEVSSKFQPMEYPKNYFLLKQNNVCRHLWFLEKGCVRYFHADGDGKEHNVWFSFEQEIVTDAPSVINGHASFENIQLLEDCTLFSIPYQDIQLLLENHHSFALWYIKLVEKHYISQIEDRLADLQFLSAKQRYEKLLGQFPGITNRISLGHIASYLNITQETLSRIRAGKT